MQISLSLCFITAEFIRGLLQMPHGIFHIVHGFGNIRVIGFFYPHQIDLTRGRRPVTQYHVDTNAATRLLRKRYTGRDAKTKATINTNFFIIGVVFLKYQFKTKKFGCGLKVGMIYYFAIEPRYLCG